MMKKYWIFDWSGTLVDDMGLVIDATNYVFEQFGVAAIDRDEFREQFCLPYEEFYRRYLPEVGMEEVEEHFREGMKRSTTPVTELPQTREFLEFLTEQGAELYVLTSVNAAEFTQQVVGLGLEGYFKTTYAGVLDKRKVICEILELHQIPAAEVVYVGDMTHDIETAHQAQIMSIGVLTGYNRAPVLAAAEPSLMVQDLSVVQEMLAAAVPTAGSKIAAEAVKIRGLEVPTFIGVPDEERAEQQVLKVSADMVPQRGFESLADEIEGGVDYYQVACRIKALALETPRKLVETLAADIARMIKAEFPVKEVRVEIEKFILPDADSVGVEITL